MSCTCNTLPTDCCPVHGDCDTPSPVMPRCNNVLPPGVYPWATVTVDANGCISDLQQGEAPLYQPDPCCALPGGGGGGGGSGPPGPPGPPGQNASVTAGQTFTIDAGQPANVVNVGTTQNAVFDFYIPRGPAGSSGGGGGGGLTIDDAGIVFENGLLQEVPDTWPPVMDLETLPSGVPDLDIVVNISPVSGVGTIQLNALQYDTNIQDRLSDMQDAIDQLTARVDQLESDLADCCP